MKKLAMALLGNLLLFSVLAAVAAPPLPLKEGYIANGDHPLYYKTMGEGDPILVLHGGPGFDHRQFLPFIWELTGNHQVILYDQRCTGLSSGPVDSAAVNIETFVEDVETVRRFFGLEKVNLLGHSWGGNLAMYYASRHEDRLKSLILCSTSATEASFGRMQANYEARREPGDGQRMMEIYRSEAYQSGDPEAVERFWRVYFKPYFPDQSQVNRLDLVFTPNSILNGQAVAELVLGSIGPFDLHEDLQRLRCPTLILHGQKDPMDYQYAERLHQCIQGSELVIIPDAGHWLFVDGTSTFTRSILGFLEGIKPR